MTAVAKLAFEQRLEANEMRLCGSFRGRLSKLEERPLQTTLQKGIWEQAGGGFKVSGGLVCLVHSG